MEETIARIENEMRERGFIPKALVLLILYILTARLGLSLHPVNHFATFIWLPSGLALGALVVGGYRYAYVVLIGAFLVNFSIGASTIEALGIALGNTLEAVAGLSILRNVIGFDPLIGRVRDAFGLMLVSLFTSALAALVGVTSLLYFGSISLPEFSTTWTTWWIGDALGMIMVAPFMIRWLPRPLPHSWFKQDTSYYVEMVTALTTLAAVDLFVYWTTLGYVNGILLFYLTLLPLGWIALRLGPRPMTFAIFLNGSIGITGLLFGPLSAVNPPSPENLLSFQLIMAAISLVFLFFVTLEEERKEAQNALRHHAGELEEALTKMREEEQAKNDFMAILAHELRNPLAPVLSAVELLKLQGETPAPIANLLEVIDGRVRTMGRLLDDLLDLSRITHKQFTIKKEPTDLRPVLRASIAEAAPLIKSRRHRLKTMYPKDLTLYVDGDPMRLEQVFANLLNNAAKYTDPHGEIELTAEKESDTAVIHVCDNGIGIPQNMLTRIFEPFLQAARGRGPVSSSGIGVGLAVTKNIIEMHGGSIEAKSRGENAGSEFVVRLPLLSQIPQQIVREPSEKHEKLNKKFKVLVVDDNEAAAQGIEKLLGHKGHEVAVAYHGIGALETIQQFHPHIAILDIGLPDIDGYEVARRIREELFMQSTTLIALSGYGQEEDKRKATEAGFDFYLTKPVGLTDIEQVFGRIGRKNRRNEPPALFT